MNLAELKLQVSNPEWVQEQYDQSRVVAQNTKCPVFNVFYNVPNRPTVQFAYFDTKTGLPVEDDAAQAKLKAFHAVDALDGTVE